MLDQSISNQHMCVAHFCTFCRNLALRMCSASYLQTLYCRDVYCLKSDNALVITDDCRGKRKCIIMFQTKHYNSADTWSEGSSPVLLIFINVLELCL